MSRIPIVPVLIALCLVVALSLSGCAGASQSPAPSASPTQAAMAESAEATPTAAAEETAAGSTSVPFEIRRDASQVRFIIDEELMGAPKTVVGITDDVSGQLLVDVATPANSQVGEIVIGADNFVTDSDRRNGAIRRFVLQSGQYPTITFVPSGLAGLPAAVAVGDTVAFQVTGDLTIRDVTRAVSFDVSLEVVSATELRLSGRAQVLRSDYDLTIPSVPSVANVTDEVQLELALVLTAP